MEAGVGLSVEKLSQILTLSSVKNFGPQKFKAVYDAGLRPDEVIQNPNLLPMTGKRADGFRREIEALRVENGSVFTSRAKRQIAAAAKADAKILTYWSDLYPANAMRSNYAVPVLYARGSVDLLRERKTVACVGSRRIRSPYSDRHREFAELASSLGFAVVSGFALGADTVGHLAALESSGTTICVLPGGLERPFPPENRSLWEDLLRSQRAAMVSEAPFGTRASSLLLRRRNKLIVALSLGVLVSQSAADGGAMNAFRFARDQRKPVATFEPDGSEDTSGNLVMGHDETVDMRVFSAGSADREAWRDWLQRLSFLT